MNSLYSQIKQYIGNGLYVVVVDRQGNTRTFFHEKPNKNLVYISSILSEELEICSDDEATINNQDSWKIHSLLPRPITPYPVGMKVRISEEYSKCSEALVDIVELAKHKVVVTIDAVEEYTYGSLVYEFSYKNYVWYVDHRFLIPVLEEEKEEITRKMEKEDWVYIGRKNGWIKGGEVIE